MISLWRRWRQEQAQTGRRARPSGHGHGRRVRLELEALEDRCLPAPFTVTSAADSGPGTLRAEIALAAASPDLSDTITFDLTQFSGPIQLSSATLTLGKNLTIQGPGANRLTVQGNSTFRIFTINPAITAAISGLTIKRGGGGIVNAGTLTLTDSTVEGNTAGFGGVGAFGGGIDNIGTLTLTDSTVSGNTAGISLERGFGGGIDNDHGTLTLINSTVAGNTAGSGAGSGFGGGIVNYGTLTLTNSSVAGNTAGGGGGDGFGGGIDNVSTLTLTNTIVARNTARNGPDIDGPVTSLGHNLVGDTSDVTGLVASDLINVDPRLGRLQDNGGPTQTMALLPGSPAIDAAQDGVVGADQRGVSRPQGRHADIGAFEFTPPPPSPPPLVPARALVATLVNKKVGMRRRLFVRVSFADTGALKAEVRSPFQKPAFGAIAVSVFDSNGDGVADTVRLTARKGNKTWTRLITV